MNKTQQITKNPDILDELNSEKIKAIPELDFDKAEELYNKIQEEISRRNTDSFAQFLLELSDISVF